MPKRPRNPDYLYKLAGRIKEKYGTQADFAYAMKATGCYVSSHLSRKTDFQSRDIRKWCDLLEIRSDEIREYFMPDWKPKADRIVPSGKAKARFDPINGGIVCNAYTGTERR